MDASAGKRESDGIYGLGSIGVGLGFGLITPALLESFAHFHLRSPAPGVLLLTAVVLSAFIAGMTSGLISSLLLSAYSFYAFGFFSDSGSRALTFLVLSPIVAICVGLLKRRTLKLAELAADAALHEAEQRARSQMDGERGRARQEISAKEEQFRAAIEASLDAFDLLEAIRDKAGTIIDFRIVQVNARTEKLTGYARAQMIGKPVCELFPVTRDGGFFEKYVAVVETREPWLSEFPISADNVHAGWLSQQVVAVGDGVAIFSRDITDHKRLEEQLRQSQKMESVGRLAGGVAHDFNNLLTVINGYAELAATKITASHDKLISSALKNIMTAGGRAAELTRQLLAFARKQVIEPRVIDLNELLAEGAKMLTRVIGEDIELVTRPSQSLWKCKADPGQVTQVLINLSVNARDAMQKGGKLTIETSNVTLDAAYCANHAEVTPGEYVMLAVSDTGSGMDEESKKHVFEPFYTTKAVGQGTGLGLSTCYGVVKQSGGHIWFYSEVGIGTTFKVYLPRISSTQAEAEPKAVPVVSRGSECILLVEDEPMVRDFAVLTLRSSGYDVVHAPDARAALVKADEMAMRLDLLVTDVVMPAMSGKELAEKLRGKRPNLRVLFMSGYTANVIVHHGVLDEGVQFLPKPFSPAELARKVREVLDAKS